jgi:RNA methyltransferase, TrmH family
MQSPNLPVNHPNLVTTMMNEQLDPRDAAAGQRFNEGNLGVPTGLRSDEQKIYGVSACRAIYQTRSDDLVRAYVTPYRLKLFGGMLRWCAAHRLAYHIIEDADMERVTQSTHHEGVCLLVKERPQPRLEEWLEIVGEVDGPQCVLLLEHVGNPHNLGAILRVAAHFGAVGVLVTGPMTRQPQLPAAVYRTSEGGAEHVPVVSLGTPYDALDKLRKGGFGVLATSGRGRYNLYSTEFQLPKRCVLMLGSEERGLSPGLLAAADAVIAIPGTGQVESLNIACAAATFLGEYWRQHPGVAAQPQAMSGSSDGGYGAAE